MKTEKNKKDTIIDILTDLATDVLIINENIDDTDRLDKEELRLKKYYAAKILKIVKK